MPNLNEVNGDYILYAEDNNVDAMLFQRAMRKSAPDATLVRLEDGAKAWEYLEEAITVQHGKLPTLCAFDIKMPGLTGLDLLQKVKAHPATEHIPVVLLTASYEQRDLEKAYEDHVNAYVIKPDSYAELCDLAKSLATFWLKFNRRLQ